MHDPGGEGDDEAEVSTSRPSWIKVGAAAGLGFEFVGFVLAGVFIGTRLDARYDSSPVGLLVCLGLAMVAAGWHIYLVSRRYLLDGEES